MPANAVRVDLVPTRGAGRPPLDWTTQAIGQQHTSTPAPCKKKQTAFSMIVARRRQFLCQSPVLCYTMQHNGGPEALPLGGLVLVSRLTAALANGDTAAVVEAPCCSPPPRPFASFVYQLARCVAQRARGGFNRGSTSSTTTSSSARRRRLWTVLVATDEEQREALLSYPTISLAVADGDLAVVLSLTELSSPVLAVFITQHDASPPLKLVAAEDDFVIAIGTAASPSSSLNTLDHRFPCGGGIIISLSSPRSRPLASDAHASFVHVTESALDPFDTSALARITPIVSRSYQRKLVFGGAAAVAPPAPATKPSISVWSQPAASGSVSLALAVLRLAPDALGALLPLFQDKVSYLRNTFSDLGYDVAEAVEAAALLHAPRCDEEMEGFSSLLADAARLLFRIGNGDAALRVGSLAPGLCGDSFLPALVIHGRCLEAAGALPGALACFRGVLGLEPGHGEAGKALLRLEKAAPKISPVATLGEEAPVQHAAAVGAASADDDEGSGASEKRGVGAWERIMLRAKEKAAEGAGFQRLEAGKRLSISIMYQLMRNFYNTRGMSAWGGMMEGGSRQEVVPFYITSNSFIARAYARVIACWLHDVAPMCDLAEPIIVLELGTGPGKFSGLVLRFLVTELERLQLEHLPVVYCMSDFTLANVDAWETDPCLAPHLAAGRLDFALLDCDDPNAEIALRQSGAVFSRSSPSKNPIFVISNYLFDSIVMDAFRVGRAGALEEALVTTYAKRGAADEAGLDPSVNGKP